MIDEGIQGYNRKGKKQKNHTMATGNLATEESVSVVELAALALAAAATIGRPVVVQVFFNQSRSKKWLWR
jgi:hypothetical protein